jgi:hypothetical protein
VAAPGQYSRWLFLDFVVGKATNDVRRARSLQQTGGRPARHHRRPIDNGVGQLERRT